MIVVEADHQIKGSCCGGGSERLHEGGVGRQRSCHLDAFGPCLGDSRRKDMCLFISEESAVRGMGVQCSQGNAWGCGVEQWSSGLRNPQGLKQVWCIQAADRLAQGEVDAI